ncbi:hypothetical protein [Syntrophotalea acetylenica]|nr:hypothetical protein [Syntrophotalea acetylenica]MDY0262481.1 hypothetical protein [Syntrophotalea acetylenica]
MDRFPIAPTLIRGSALKYEQPVSALPVALGEGSAGSCHHDRHDIPFSAGSCEKQCL